MEVPKGHSAQLLSGRVSQFSHPPHHSPPPGTVLGTVHPPSLPFYLSIILQSSTHSNVFQESQDKQWEYELLMVTQLMTQGHVLHQAHDY